MYTDTSGQQQSTLLGNVADLRTVKVKEVGGIPIEKLQAHYDIQRDRQGRKDSGMPSSIVGFPDERQIPLPPDTVKVYAVSEIPMCIRFVVSCSRVADSTYQSITSLLLQAVMTLLLEGACWHQCRILSTLTGSCGVVECPSRTVCLTGSICMVVCLNFQQNECAKLSLVL